MITCSKQDVRRDASSHVDPHGFVFHLNGDVYRLIYKAARPFYDRLFESGLMRSLADQHGLVNTEIADLRLLEHAGGLVLRHEKIDPLTYCVEWCPSMLRAAAAATLSLAEELAGKGMTLQDAYPWNVLFSGPRPVFVDVTSIVPEDAHVIWPAHEQYEAYFYRPLVLAAQGLGQTARMLLYDNVEGISLDAFYRLSSAAYRWWHPGLFLTQALSRRVQHSAAAKRRLRHLAASASKYLTREVRLRFLRRLQWRLEAVRLSAPSDPWKDYYSEIPPDVNKDQKLSTVQRFLEELRPATVLDLGCNTGVFSIAAARQKARVVSIDSSESCIESLYHRAEADCLSITPLVMNVLCTTPGFGFLGRQYPPFFERARAETVLCLGLMHHLHLSGRQSFDRISHLVDEASTRHVIFEFVARDDANIEHLPQRRTIDYTLDSVRDALAARFARIETFDSDRLTRKLLLCSKS